MADRPTLRAHQVQGVAFLANHDHAAQVVDRGCGKTAIMMGSLSDKLAAKRIHRILYCAPLSTLVNVKREALRFGTGLLPQVVYGTRRKRVKMVETPGDRNLDIINFDAVRTLFKELMAAKYDAIVVDESTRIKDRDTRVTIAMFALGQGAVVKCLMTGMPFTEGVEDCWSQFYFLDPKILGPNYYSFRNRYCVLRTEKVRRYDERKKQWVTRNFHKIVGYRNLNEFEARVSPYCFRAAKEDCVDLPDKIFEVLRVKMMEAQRKAYKQVEKMPWSIVGGEKVDHKEALARIQKLRQVAAGFIYDGDHNPVYIPSKKYEVLVDVLADTLWGKRKAVVFTSFRAEPGEVERAVLRMSKAIKVFHLPVNPLDRQTLIDEWSVYPSAAILVANARSGGIGLNLTAAHHEIFMSNDWRMEDRAQAIDRCHRIGSEIHDKILITDIVTEGTVEEDILEALQNKTDLVELFLERMRQQQKGRAS